MAGIERFTVLRQHNAGADMARVSDHLSVAELQASYRGSKEATLARHYQVIWLLAQGRTVAETARLTGFVPRWIEELLVRYNRFGPSSLGDRRRGNGARPTILTPPVLTMLRERLKRPPDDGGVWTSKKSRGADRGRARAGVRGGAARLGGAPRHRLDDPAAPAPACPRSEP